MALWLGSGRSVSESTSVYIAEQIHKQVYGVTCPGVTLTNCRTLFVVEVACAVALILCYNS
jgi:hypothetical protein